MGTPILRPTIGGPVPLALIDAPSQGTGKGLLAEVVALIATGRPAAMMAAPHGRDSDDEWRKRLTSALLAGPSVVTIDNVEGTLTSASLASVLTPCDWHDRVLGKTEMATLPNRATWQATGNNLQVGGDLGRRCYWIRLDAKTSRPWQRTGFRHPDLLGWVASNRGRLLGALLTLARAWVEAGKPPADVPVLGGFTGWVETVGGVLAHAGVIGFLGNLDELHVRVDGEALEWEAFLAAWYALWGDTSVGASQVVEACGPNKALADVAPGVLAEACEKPCGSANAKVSVGRILAGQVGRRYGENDWYVESLRDRHTKTNTYRVRPGTGS